MSQQSPVTCTSSRYVNRPSEVEEETVECLSALLGQGHSALHFCVEIFNSWTFRVVADVDYCILTCHF